MDKLREIYEKDIEREIQGVIKVDDESFIKQELEEYVVTDELLKHFEKFFEMYEKSINGTTENMGTWISGFFGSGKSHFLKIISYLLENKVVDGKPAVEYFNNKIKDEVLLNRIKTAGNIPTDVILFNIDSKATMDALDGKDKILAVFEKVFNEKLGLSTIPHVAELERFLIRENKYEEFKKYFQEESGRSWEESRNDFYFIRDEVVNSYSKALGKSKEEAENWFDKAEERYELSIEILAKRIKDYIDTKNDNHHVVFLVDEVGQYIGKDSKLMLNLQTIVEDLGVECGGKAWVIVTSQEAIDDVVKISGDDFSKIQGRFKTRLSLSSSDIDEVIKKRVLEKKDEYKESLALLYDKNESIIRNLLTFKSDTAYQKLYEDRNDFAETYPFIPYQFRLLQKVFTNIRKQGYAGMHLANGERSLLGAFQGTAKKYGDYEINTLIPFYSFYDTIEEFLEHPVKNVIKEAEDGVKGGVLESTDVNVLKMLFMLKNIDGVPANVENLSTLYISNINDDKLAIKTQIQESLKRLEAQTLIQRNNNEYKFLTDDEQEINREIKRIAIDPKRTTEYLHQLIYREIFPENRYMYNKKPFDITKYVDDLKLSQNEYEIGIKVMISNVGSDDQEIKTQSAMNVKYVFVKLELPALTMDEINTCLKTKEYRKSKIGTSLSDQVEDILRAKEREVDSLEKIITSNIKETLAESKIIIAGDIQNISAKEPRSRIEKALEILINNIFNKFSYVQKNYETTDIRELFSANKQLMLEEEKSFQNQKAYEAVKESIESDNMFNKAVTIRSLLTKFSGSPYGFLENDILYILTKLIKNEEVNLIYSGTIQEASSPDTLNKILKRDYYEKTLVQIRKKIDNDLINNLKNLSRNSFNKVILEETEDGITREFKEIVREVIAKINELNVYYNQNNVKEYQYPGQSDVNEVKEVLSKIANTFGTLEIFEVVKDNTQKLTELMPKYENVKEFFDGQQKTTFEDARKTLVKYDENESYIEELDDETKDIINKLKEIIKSREPYSSIHELPTLRTKLIDALTNIYDKQAQPIIEEVKQTIEYFKNNIDNSGLSLEEFGQWYIDTCTETIDILNKSSDSEKIYAQQKKIENLKSNFDIALAKKIEEKNKPSGNVEEPIIIKQRKRIKTDLLMKKSYEINSKEDIEKYIEELKEKLMKELEENNNLIIN